MKRWVALAFLAAVVLTVLVVGRQALQHWLAIHTGTVNESGPYYGFWSGFGSDLGEVTLIGAIVVPTTAAWRHHNCHVKRCPFLGRPVEGTPYLACWRHHPARTHHDHRAVTAEHIEEAHGSK